MKKKLQIHVFRRVNVCRNFALPDELTPDYLDDAPCPIIHLGALDAPDYLPAGSTTRTEQTWPGAVYHSISIAPRQIHREH